MYMLFKIKNDAIVYESELDATVMESNSYGSSTWEYIKKLYHGTPDILSDSYLYYVMWDGEKAV